MLVNGKQQCLCWQLPNIILHMAVKLSRRQCQCFAFSYHRQREILYKSVSHIPICPRLAAKVWLVWSWPYQFLCILLDLAATLPRGLQYPCTQWPCRAIRSLVSTGEQGYYSLVGIQLEWLGLDCKRKYRNSRAYMYTLVCIHESFCSCTSSY